MTELGCESVKRLTVENFSATSQDSVGGNLYTEGVAKYKKRLSQKADGCPPFLFTCARQKLEIGVRSFPYDFLVGAGCPQRRVFICMPFERRAEGSPPYGKVYHHPLLPPPLFRSVPDQNIVLPKGFQCIPTE